MDKTAQAVRLSECVPALCDWFEAGRRLLPWRTDPTPYRVWVSEIMLQQTRIEAVLPYFERFTAELPTVEALSRVSSDRLMKLWEGLGYYSRARNLQKAAKILVEEYGGALPDDYDKLLSLPGIGAYTAGAVASIAFGIAVPAVDGNVLRVLARLTACRDEVTSPAVRRAMTALSAALVPPDRPGVFNQALMELGERVCLPNTLPHCGDCPVRAWCAAEKSGEAADLPVRAAKKARRIEQRTVTVLITREKEPRVLLHRRPAKGLLAGLWELPNTQGFEPPVLPGDAGQIEQLSDWLPLEDSRHIFTHIEWHMKGALCLIAPFAPTAAYSLADAAALKTDHALPTAFRAYAHMLPTWLALREDDEWLR